MAFEITLRFGNKLQAINFARALVTAIGESYEVHKAEEFGPVQETDVERAGLIRKCVGQTLHKGLVILG